MDHRRKVARNSLAFLAAGIVGHLYALATAPLLTRVLSPDEWGLFTIFVQINTLLQYGALTFFSQSLLKFYAGYEAQERRAFVGTSFTVLVLLQATLVVALYVTRSTLLPAVYPNVHLPLDPTVGWACIWFLAAPLRMFGLALLRVREQARAVIVLNAMYGVALFALLGLLVVVYDFGIVGALTAMAAAEWLCLVATVVAVRNDVSITLQWTYLQRSLRFATPLLGSTACFLFANNLDRWALSRHVDLATLGTYGIGATIGNSLALVVTAAMTAVSPRIVAVLTREGDDAARALASTSLVDTLAFVGIPFGILCLGSDVLATVVGAGATSVHIATGVAIGIAAGHLIRSVYLTAQNILFYKEQTRQLLANSLVLALLAAMLAPILVRGGPVAIAWLLGSSYLLLAPLTFGMARKLWRLAPDVRAIAWLTIGLAGALATSLMVWWMQWSVGDWRWWSVKIAGAALLLATCAPRALLMLRHSRSRTA